MKLYYKPGACSMASHITLIETGVPYTLELTNTVTGLTETGQYYSDINPNGYVPALELAPGQVLTENPAILEYLAELSPARALIPSSMLEKAKLREALAFLASELHKAFSPFFQHTPLTVSERASAELKLAKRLDTLEQRLAGNGPYLLGATLSVADFYGFVILNWTQFINFSLQPWPAVHKFWQLLGTHPSVLLAMQKEGLTGG